MKLYNQILYSEDDVTFEHLETIISFIVEEAKLEYKTSDFESIMKYLVHESSEVFKLSYEDTMKLITNVSLNKVERFKRN